MAARGARAARRPDAEPWHLDGGSRERPAISSRRGGIPGGTSKARAAAEKIVAALLKADHALRPNKKAPQLSGA